MDLTSLKWLTAQDWNREWARDQPLSVNTAAPTSTENGPLHLEIERLKAQLTLEQQRVAKLTEENAICLGQVGGHSVFGNDQVQLFKRLFENMEWTVSTQKRKNQIYFGMLFESLCRKFGESENGIEGYDHILKGTEIKQGLVRLKEKMQEYGKMNELVEDDVGKLSLFVAQLVERVQKREDLLKEFNLPQLIQMVDDYRKESDADTNTNSGPQNFSTKSAVVELKPREIVMLLKKRRRVDEEEEEVDITKKPRQDAQYDVHQLTVQLEDSEED